VQKGGEGNEKWSLELEDKNVSKGGKGE